MTLLIINYVGNSHFDFLVEYLNTLEPLGMPLHTLTLKWSAVVMLLWNLNLKAVLCNGVSQLVLESKPHVTSDQE